MPGWTSKQRGDLLNRALFDPAAFGLVRFHHRSATDYLAACWLDNLLASELSIHETLSLFFARSLGEEVLIPSRAAVVCWLACRDNIWNRRIREKLIAIAPDALLSHGDVCQLDVATRKALLLGLASRAAQEEEILRGATDDQLKRLAHEELSDTINELLLNPQASEDVRVILLGIICEGALARCVTAAFDIGADPNASSYILVYVIAAVAAAGSGNDKEHFILDLLARPELSESVSRKIVSSFYPGSLSGEQIVQLAKITRPDRRSTISRFPYAAAPSDR